MTIIMTREGLEGLQRRAQKIGLSIKKEGHISLRIQSGSHYCLVDFRDFTMTEYAIAYHEKNNKFPEGLRPKSL